MYSGAVTKNYTVPAYSKARVDGAGKVLSEFLDLNKPYDYGAFDEAVSVANNWRAAHGFPLNTMTVGLRRRAARVDPNALTAQRIKRLVSIRQKLLRFPGLRLSQMQDLGGCRAVVASVNHVNELVALYRKGDLKHKLVRLDDYMARPQNSGYRGVHLIYRYVSDKQETYNGLLVEMQLRSQTQHAWATAVETVGTFTRQALKSSQGEGDWLRFFALMGTALAFQEGTASVGGTPGKMGALVDELRAIATKLDVTARLRAYGLGLSILEDTKQNAHYFLMVLEPSAAQVQVTGFSRDQLDEAQRQYLAAEKSILDKDDKLAVLVSVDSFTALQRAYPNYFLDTQLFLGIVEQALAGA